MRTTMPKWRWLSIIRLWCHWAIPRGQLFPFLWQSTNRSRKLATYLSARLQRKNWRRFVPSCCCFNIHEPQSQLFLPHSLSLLAVIWMQMLTEVLMLTCTQQPLVPSSASMMVVALRLMQATPLTLSTAICSMTLQLAVQICWIAIQRSITIITKGYVRSFDFCLRFIDFF